MKRIVAALSTVGALVAGTLATAPLAQAASVTAHGIKISVPSAVTAYNGAKAVVKPTAKVSSGLNESVTKTKILAYKGKKRVASGASVKLKVGSYKQQVQVTYSSWTYTTKTTTKQVLRDPDDVANYGDASNVTCRVTQVDAYGLLVSGVCTSPNYPGQTVTIDDAAWCSTQTPYPLTVGETATDNVCYDVESNFKPYYVTVPVQTKVKTGVKSHTFTTAKKTLKIVDGGHRMIWSGGYVKDDDGYTTRAFTVPAHWTISYGYADLSDDLGVGCVFDASVYQYKSGQWKYIDNVVDAWDEGDTGGVKYSNSAGKTKVWINSSCDYWAVVVTWK